MSEVEELKIKIAELKAENEAIRQTSITHKAYEIIKTQIRKETAKEILQDLYLMQKACYREEIILRKLCEKYGVELLEVEE